MPIISYIFSVVAALLMLSVIIAMLMRKRLRERHALWWLVLGVLALIAALFPNLLESATRALGITLPISLVFFIGIVILFLVSVQQSAELTDLEEKCRILAEQHALLSRRVRELEESPGEESKPVEPST